eukprot:3241157-Rhodomonas_salina.1
MQGRDLMQLHRRRRSAGEQRFRPVFSCEECGSWYAVQKHDLYGRKLAGKKPVLPKDVVGLYSRVEFKNTLVAMFDGTQF